MWVWTLNWGRIRDDIVVGSCPMTAADIDRIRDGTRVSALLSVQTEECRAAFGIDYDEHCRHGRSRDLALVNAPMRDFDPPDQRRRLPEAVRALHRLIAAGHRVYVHCTAGINRSPLTVLGYLAFVEGLTEEEAMAVIRGGRPQAEPYWEAFHGCRRDLADRNRDAIAAKAYLLWQDSPEAAAEANWRRAAHDVIRELLVTGGAADTGRLDPHRG